MEFNVYLHRIENADHGDRDEFRIPTRREMAMAPLFWNMVGSILSGVAGHAEVENERIAALRRNAEHYDRQRRPTVVQEIVAEAIDHVKAAVSDMVPAPIQRALAKPATAKQRAVDWLSRTLSGVGQLPSKEVESMAVLEGISPRTLRRAAKSAGIRHVKKGRGSWVYVLIQAKPGPVRS
jgi:hypothetical protein